MDRGGGGEEEEEEEEGEEEEEDEDEEEEALKLTGLTGLAAPRCYSSGDGERARTGAGR